MEEPAGGTDGGSIRDLIREADERVGQLRLPRMRKPEHLGEEYTFPSDASRLTGLELASLSLKLSGWYSYLLQELGREDSELGAIESVYEASLGVKMHEKARSYERNKPVKETLKALVLDEDKQLAALHRVILRRRMVLRRLEAQSEIYREQLNRLSREQSRRESEARAGGGF